MRGTLNGTTSKSRDWFGNMALLKTNTLHLIKSGWFKIEKKEYRCYYRIKNNLNYIILGKFPNKLQHF